MVVTCLILKYICAICAGISAPEEIRASSRIPVSLAYALEKCAEAYSVPFEVKIETELITGSLVSDALKVTMVIKSP